MHSTKFFTILTTILLSAVTAAAWTGPTSTPPNANASEPFNVSAASQTKLGSLGAYGLFLTGTTKIAQALGQHSARASGQRQAAICRTLQAT
jgi:hypothetical protein